MLTGQPPFGGSHAVEVLNAVINRAPRPLHDLNPKVPAALQPVLDRALAKAAKDRYQTIAALRDELKAVMRRLSRETGLVPTEASATLLPPQRARATWLLTPTLERVLGRLRPPGPARPGGAAPGPHETPIPPSP